MPDNAGAEPLTAPVVPGGPATASARCDQGHAPPRSGRRAGEVSQTAGTFVCSHVFYGLMHRLALRAALARTRGGFVHVPLLPERGTPSLALEDQVKGLRAAIAAALTQREVICDKRRAPSADSLSA